MRFLVTGVSGQIGNEAAQSFTQLGNVIAADRNVLDLSQPNTLSARLDELRPDMIVNAAAYTAVDRAEDERELAFTINAESPGIMAQWAAIHGAPFVHFSTDYVFDGSGEIPWREDDVAGPLSAYGASKLAGEQQIRTAAGPHLIVRTSWIYAARGTNFLRTIARFAREREELKIVADQIGAPTSAAFVAGALTKIVQTHQDDLPTAFSRCGGLLHMAAAGHTSWHGFALAIVEGLRRRGATLEVRRILPIPSGAYPTKAVRPRNSRLDLTRLRECFGIRPPSWQALLEPEIDGLAPPQT